MGRRTHREGTVGVDPARRIRVCPSGLPAYVIGCFRHCPAERRTSCLDDWSRRNHDPRRHDAREPGPQGPGTQVLYAAVVLAALARVVAGLIPVGTIVL